MSRAIENYKLRTKKLKENSKEIRVNLIEKLFWAIAKYPYIFYIKKSGKNILISRFFLIIAIILYPGLFTLYYTRLKKLIFNK